MGRGGQGPSQAQHLWGEAGGLPTPATAPLLCAAQALSLVPACQTLPPSCPAPCSPPPPWAQTPTLSRWETPRGRGSVRPAEAEVGVRGCCPQMLREETTPMALNVPEAGAQGARGWGIV